MPREADLNAKGYSERDEKRILDALGRGLLKEFPNPERKGCPGAEILEGIASHELPLKDAGPWLDHLTSCSPCYQEFSRLRAAFGQRRKRTLLAIAASILIVGGIAGWAFFARQREPLVAQTAIIDLRGRSVARGGEPNPGEPPVEVSRAATHWTIYLPLGSAEGPYDVRIVTLAGKTIAQTSGTAKLKDHVTSLEVGLRLSTAHHGQYFLEVRTVSSGWSSFRFSLK